MNFYYFGLIFAKPQHFAGKNHPLKTKLEFFVKFYEKLESILGSLPYFNSLL